MIGMDLGAFSTLLVVSLVVSILFFYGLKYRLGPEFEGLLGKILFGWLGAWIGPPVVGHWGPKFNGVYVIPALVGSAATIFIVVRFFKTVNLVDARELAQKVNR